MKRRLNIIASVLLLVGASVCARAVEPAAAADRAAGAGVLDNAYRLMAHGEFEQAAKVLDAILTRPAGEDGKPIELARALQAETMFLLGRAHEELGRYDAALRAYSVVTKEYADSEVFANASMALAELYIRADAPEKAAGALEAALEGGLSPAHQFRARLILAEALSVPGTKVADLERALTLFQALDSEAKDAADVARISYGLDFCHQQQNDWKKAEAEYLAAMQAE
jgi:tetratricopeptide (TPR) repeat protein